MITVGNSFSSITCTPDTFAVIKKALSYKNDENYYQRQNIQRNMSTALLRKQYRWYNLLQKKLDLLGPEDVCWISPKGVFPTGLLKLVTDALNALGEEYTLQDNRQKPTAKSIAYKRVLDPLRPYQIEASAAAISGGQGILEMSCASGKTHTLIDIICKLGCKCVVVVPSSALLQQTGDDIRDALGDVVSDINATSMKKSLKPIRISTYQALAAMHKKRKGLEKVFEDVGAIFIDEYQTAGCSSISNLIPYLDHVYYRIGLTGSFTRSSKIMDMHTIASERLYHYPPKLAIEQKYITPVKLKIYDVEGIYDNDYKTEYTTNYEKNPNYINAITNVVGTLPKDENILLLVERKDKLGVVLYDDLKSRGYDVTYISGDDSKEVINATIKDFNKGKIKLLIASQVCGRGVNIKSAHHLLWCRGGKSEEAYVQGVGRVIRLYPGKIVAYVHDFRIKNSCYLEKHLKERIETFKQYFNGEVVNGS